MSKMYFWPIALIVMGLVILANNYGMLPASYWNLWPLILVVVGLGGVLTADRQDWLYEDKSKKTSSKKSGRKSSKKKNSSRKS